MATPNLPVTANLQNLIADADESTDISSSREIKEAQVIFDAVWNDLKVDFSREDLRFPKEFILLGGAPGAGKGTNTVFIARTRGLTCPPIVMSSLLDTAEMKKIKNAGQMVGDREVLTALLHHLLKPEYRDGVILDGFPRTTVQVECLKLLYKHMVHLWREFYGTPLRVHFRQSIVHIVVLFVDEKESIARQLKRGREVKSHNESVHLTGRGELLEERVTDFDETLAARRYRVFKEQTWDALLSLKDTFHYHFIDAQGSIDKVEDNILKELEYQSSLELDTRTYEQLRSLPLASEIIVHARQELVKRLDVYALNYPELFARTISFVDKKLMPIIRRHAISGYANINSEDPLLDDSLALAMILDVFSERGFHPVVDIHRIEIPDKVDNVTGKIYCHVKKVYRFIIRFTGSEIRRE